jgi:hypothetical protein
MNSDSAVGSLPSRTDTLKRSRSPAKGKAFALLWFNGLNAAGVISLKKHTTAVGLLNERQGLPIKGQSCVLLCKCVKR